MSQDYSPSLVTNGLAFCGDAAMKSTAGPATLLYDKVNDNNGTMYCGSCLDFDGTDDFVSIADNSTLDITGVSSVIPSTVSSVYLNGTTIKRNLKSCCARRSRKCNVANIIARNRFGVYPITYRKLPCPDI